ncbi:MAG: TetR/AcrR family transcriptional regulator [Kiritimatiellaeota bacterium]|nr:TetR/AcrR family transcriptional regulator [Kiritimatiellota bacterium]
MQKRAEITHGNILKAARKLFAKYGCHGASVDKIANLAKANKQRVHAYFGSKSKLFETVLIDAYKETNRGEADLRRALNADPTELTRTLLSHFINLHRKHPDFWRLITWANLEDEPFHKTVKNINAGIMEIVRPFFEKAKKRGAIPIRRGLKPDSTSIPVPNRCRPCATS